MLTVRVGDVFQKVREIAEIGKIARDISPMPEVERELPIAVLELHACMETKSRVMYMCEIETLILTD